MPIFVHVAAFFVCCCQGLLAAASIHGVEPGSEALYSGSTFKCEGLDGQKLSLPIASVNDDSCDCEDGSDEPGTGACAGQDKTLFFCTNEGSTSRRIYASRVDDGLCDCCDGSDEATLAQRSPASACPNTCAEEGALAKQEAAKQIELLSMALQHQNEIRAKGIKDREKWNEELAQLNHQLTDFQQAFDSAKEAADAERAAEAERKKAADAAAAAAKNESGLLCMWRQTAGCSPSGALEPANDKPCTEHIPAGLSGFCDCNGNGALDADEKGYDCEAVGEAANGHVCEQICGPKAEDTSEASEEGIEEAPPVDEKPQVSEYSKWMDGAAETLSAEEKPAEEPEEKQVSEYSKWMDGAEETMGGEADEAPEAPEEEAAEETPSEEDPEAAPQQESLKKAEELESDTSSKLSDHKDKIAELETKIESLASDDHLGYADLAGKTLSKHISEWDYKIEFFSKADQDHTNLGTWSKWTGRNTAVFDKGAMCWGGPARKLNVKFECALQQEIVDVFEPSRCVYEATVKHPGACDPAELEVLTTGSRILGPRDEL